MKCPNCGAEVRGKFCEYCGSEMPRNETVTNINNNSKKIINNYYNYIPGQPSASDVNPDNQNKPSSKSNYHYSGPGITILWLIFFFPIGLIRMWTKKEFPKSVRIAITVFFALFIIYAMLSPRSDTGSNSAITHTPSPTPIATLEPTPESKNFDSLQDAFEEGFKDGLGDSVGDRQEDISESVESIKESIEYIFSE